MLSAEEVQAAKRTKNFESRRPPIRRAAIVDSAPLSLDEDGFLGHRGECGRDERGGGQWPGEEGSDRREETGRGRREAYGAQQEGRSEGEGRFRQSMALADEPP